MAARGNFSGCDCGLADMRECDHCDFHDCTAAQLRRVGAVADTALSIAKDVSEALQEIMWVVDRLYEDAQANGRDLPPLPDCFHECGGPNA